jgi:hypothetical protein
MLKSRHFGGPPSRVVSSTSFRVCVLIECRAEKRQARLGALEFKRVLAVTVAIDQSVERWRADLDRPFGIVAGRACQPMRARPRRSRIAGRRMPPTRPSTTTWNAGRAWQPPSGLSVTPLWEPLTCRIVLAHERVSSGDGTTSTDVWSFARVPDWTKRERHRVLSRVHRRPGVAGCCVCPNMASGIADRG